MEAKGVTYYVAAQMGKFFVFAFMSLLALLLLAAGVWMWAEWTKRRNERDS